MSEIAERIAAVRERTARAAERAGKRAEDVRLLAVSKRQPLEAIREAYAFGLRAFGENYAQELAAKVRETADLPDIEWHMIGHLQTNKARLVAPIAAAVHSVDSTYLATELGKRAANAGRTICVYIEVNVAGEASKTGCSPSDLAAVIEAVRTSPALDLRGLMTMPPYADDPEAARPFFAGLRALQTLHGGKAELPELSMGMSHDLEVAISEGATIVRVGTALFGERQR